MVVMAIKRKNKFLRKRFKKKTTKKKYTLHELIEQWTRAEVMARIAPINTSDATDYYMIKLKKEDAIRKLLYGMSGLVELGDYFKLPIGKKKHKKKKKRRLK